MPVHTRSLMVTGSAHISGTLNLPPGGLVNQLTDIGNVTVSSVGAGQVVSWNGNDSEWQNTSIQGTSNEIDVTLGHASIQVGLTNNVTIGGDLTLNGGDIYGPTDGQIRLRSDRDVIVKLDSDNDESGTSERKFIIWNNSESPKASIDESGNIYASSGLFVSGHMYMGNTKDIRGVSNVNINYDYDNNNVGNFNVKSGGTNVFSLNNAGTISTIGAIDNGGTLTIGTAQSEDVGLLLDADSATWHLGVDYSNNDNFSIGKNSQMGVNSAITVTTSSHVEIHSGLKTAPAVFVGPTAMDTDSRGKWLKIAKAPQMTNSYEKRHSVFLVTFGTLGLNNYEYTISATVEACWGAQASPTSIDSNSLKLTVDYHDTSEMSPGTGQGDSSFETDFVMTYNNNTAELWVKAPINYCTVYVTPIGGGSNSTGSGTSGQITAWHVVTDSPSSWSSTRASLSGGDVYGRPASKRYQSVHLSGSFMASGSFDVDSPSFAVASNSFDVTTDAFTFSSSDAKLTLVSDNIPRIRIWSTDTGGGDAGELDFRRYKTGLTTGDNIGEIRFAGSENNSSWHDMAYIIVEASEAFSAGVQEGSHIQFWSTTKGATAPVNKAQIGGFDDDVMMGIGLDPLSSTGGYSRLLIGCGSGREASLDLNETTSGTSTGYGGGSSTNGARLVMDGLSNEFRVDIYDATRSTEYTAIQVVNSEVGQVRLPVTYSSSVASSANVNVATDGKLRRATSDRRGKKGIIDLNCSLEQVASLTPRLFYGIDDENNETLIPGLVADEVESVFPDLVPERDSDPEVFRSVSYDRVVVYVVNAIKEIKERLEALENSP